MSLVERVVCTLKDVHGEDNAADCQGTCICAVIFLLLLYVLNCVGHNNYV